MWTNPTTHAHHKNRDGVGWVVHPKQGGDGDEGKRWEMKDCYRCGKRRNRDGNLSESGRMVDPVYRTGTKVALCSDPAVEFASDLDLLDI